MMDECCGNCRFWKDDKDDAGNSMGGECRRFPPPYPRFFNPGDGELDGLPWGGWPMTVEADWCGEFVARNTVLLGSPRT